jgi:RHS repeat-associated protein
MSLELGHVVAMRPRVASLPKPPQPAPPLLGSTGSPKVDAVVDVINATASPFQNAPDPARGSLGVVEHDIGAVMGVVGAPFQVLDTGFAMVTAPIAALFPSLPAAFLTVPHLGTPHGHLHPLSLTPPSPTPVPLPSIGTVMLAGCVSVLISGIPAARASDVGLAPTCFGFGPIFDIWFGSSNTWIGGSRAARMGDVTRHCNPASAMNAFGKAMGAIGVVAGAVSAGASAAAGQAIQAAMQAAQAAADAAALAMSAMLGKDPGVPPSMGALMLGNPTVLIGGFPMPDTLELLSGMLKGLKMLGKAMSKSKVFGKLLSKLGLCHSPGEPVHPYTGDVYNDFEDYVATDTGFRWERHYRSGWNETDGPLGCGFRHFYQRRLTLLRKRALYETHDGELVQLEKRSDGTYAPADGFRLLLLNSGRYELRTDRDETLEFEPQSTTPPSARLVRYRAGKIDVHLFYEAERLLVLSESVAGERVDTRLLYDGSGHVVEVRRGRRREEGLTISRYAYDDSCLVEWHDACGAVARFRYDRARRMVQGTDRRGYSFHWEYHAKSGRCVKAHGDDGLWAIEARYEGSQATFVEPDGGRWTFKHYPDGVISHIVQPDGGVQQFEKDDTGRVAKQILPGGVEVRWLYDGNGKLVHRRDQWDNLLPPEDEAPDLPDPLAHDGPENPRDWLWGRPHRRWQALVSGLSQSTRLAIERLGPFLLPGTRMPEPTRDVLGRVVERRHLDGSVERFQHDAEGNVVAHQDTKGNWSYREIASWNLVGAERSATGSVVRYEHAHFEEPRTWIDGNGSRSDYEFDPCHRVRAIRRHDTTVSRFRRDLHGAVVEKQSGDGKSLVAYENGPHGLPVVCTLASGEGYRFAYDDFGNCVDASSSVHECTQQHSHRYFFHPIPLRRLELRDGRGVRHGYDSSDRIEHTVYFERFCVEYRLLGNGRFRVFTPVGGYHDFYLTTGGQLVRENGNGTIETVVFDADDRLCARASWRRELAVFGPDRTTRYRYNAEGELLEQDDTNDDKTLYEYDADHRLIAQRDGRGVQQYAYDAAGNLTVTPVHRHVEYRRGNLVAHSHVERFEHDDRFRVAERVHFSGRTTRYVYDSRDQLIEVHFSDSDAVWRAAYDGLGRRIWREFDGKRTDFYWDDDRLMAEVAPDGKLRIYVYVNTDAVVPFMWIDYDSADAEPDSGRPFFLFTHGTGMPARVEDDKERVVWRAKSIDAYGLVEVDPESSVELRLRFAGHFYDEYTGLFYNRFRDYDPGLGRYLQPDPIDMRGGINLYAYAANPVVDVDLRGLVHKATKKPAAETHEKPPHSDTPLNEMNEKQMQDVCKWHADQLADIQDSRPGKRNTNTFSVGVIERDLPGGGKERRLVATNNRDINKKPSREARRHMTDNGIHDAHDTPPRLRRVAETSDTKMTVNQDTGEVVDKKVQTDHHAEQKMQNVEKDSDERLVAQSPSQPCCRGCNGTLGRPDPVTGARPIDQIPPDRRGTP